MCTVAPDAALGNWLEPRVARQRHLPADVLQLGAPWALAVRWLAATPRATPHATLWLPALAFNYFDAFAAPPDHSHDDKWHADHQHEGLDESFA